MSSCSEVKQSLTYLSLGSLRQQYQEALFTAVEAVVFDSDRPLLLKKDSRRLSTLVREFNEARRELIRKFLVATTRAVCGMCDCMVPAASLEQCFRCLVSQEEQEEGARRRSYHILPVCAECRSIVLRGKDFGYIKSRTGYLSVMRFSEEKWQMYHPDFGWQAVPSGATTPEPRYVIGATVARTWGIPLHELFYDATGGGTLLFGDIVIRLAGYHVAVDRGKVTLLTHPRRKPMKSGLPRWEERRAAFLSGQELLFPPRPRRKQVTIPDSQGVDLATIPRKQPIRADVCLSPAQEREAAIAVKKSVARETEAVGTRREVGGEWGIRRVAQVGIL